MAYALGKFKKRQYKQVQQMNLAILLLTLVLVLAVLTLLLLIAVVIALFLIWREIKAIRDTQDVIFDASANCEEFFRANSDDFTFSAN